MYIHYDFECSQENGTHTPSLCLAERVCQHYDSLDIDTSCNHCEAFGTQRRFIFRPQTLKMMDWLLETETYDRENVTFRHEEAIIGIAHNFKGYDGQFILNHLVHTTCIKPKVILNGSRILYMDVCGLIFVDSFIFLPCALAKMSATLGLSEIKKGYFPHFFNTEENFIIKWDPAAHYYNSDDMSIATRKTFYTCYERQQDKVFDFQKEFLDYCISYM
jgi:hypothetical protein